MVEVSAIVPVYNGETDLPGLLDCLAAQTYPRDRVEYIIADNNSSDRTVEVLREKSRDLGLTIYLVRENEIQSSYAARNAGIHVAHGDLFAFVDMDCRPEPQWLQELLQPFAEPEVGIVAGEIVALPGKTLLENYADRNKILSQKYTLEHPFLPYGQTANLAVRRRICEISGLFRPHLTTGGDADFCWRAQQQTGCRIAFAERATVKHRHRSTWKELYAQWQRYGRSNRYLHELHGVRLQPDADAIDDLRNLARWLVKEVPVKSAKVLLGRTTLADVLSTPIGLFCQRARSRGQQEAKLPTEARKIERLPQ